MIVQRSDIGGDAEEDVSEVDIHRSDIGEDVTTSVKTLGKMSVRTLIKTPVKILLKIPV